MARYVRPDLAAVDPDELANHLIAKGYAGLAIYSEGPTLDIAATEAELDAALADYVPVAAPGTWRGELSDGIRVHVAHLRDFRDAVRADTQRTKTSAVRLAELEHVTADLIDGLRLLVDDRLP